ncbi:MAG TPA: aminodeoxychorismate/anthranilate synthase component II [Longimicrobiales bacterium]|nr:aminodeoxychorismate/anthranilate synthase component II [Longimicrobiales bacterium]
MILVIDNYDSFTFNLVQMLGALGAEVEVRRNDAIDAGAVLALAPAGVVVSPGPSHPDRAGNSPAIVRALVERGRERGSAPPLLGVCLGHQVIARVFGARVERASACVHGKATPIRHDGAGVFARLDSPTSTGRYHSLAVVEATLPPELRVTARADDGVVMGVRHESLPIEGVQFHPESILTPEGETMLANFLEWTRVHASARQGDDDAPRRIGPDEPPRRLPLDVEAV